SSTNLVANDDNAFTNVYDYRGGTLVVVSGKAAGIFSGYGSSYDPVLSANGRYIAFDSTSTNLSALSTSGGYNVYVRDLSAAATTVAFVSAATNLISGLTTNGNYQVYVKPLGGATVLATAGSSGTGGTVSADASTLVTHTLTLHDALPIYSSTNLVANDD